jgi:hypothetical protein
MPAQMRHVRLGPNIGSGVALLRQRGEARGVFNGALPCCAAGLLGSFRFAFERLRDHRVDLFAVEGPLRMIDQRLREGEHDWLVLLDDRQSLLIAVLDECRAARVVAADYPGEGIGGEEVAFNEPGRAVPEDSHLGSTSAHETDDAALHGREDVMNAVARLAGFGHIPRDIFRNLHGDRVECLIASVVASSLAALIRSIWKTNDDPL